MDDGQDDWLVCMVSSQLHRAHPGLDWVLRPGDAEFAASGLKVASAFRLSRLAVLEVSLLPGQLGEISDSRLRELRQRLATWLLNDPASLS